MNRQNENPPEQRLSAFPVYMTGKNFKTNNQPTKTSNENENC